MTTALTQILSFDPSIFSIESQTSEFDRISLLRLQSIVRRICGKYVYLEIGSHLGGTLLPHLLDPACEAVHSIDPRPLSQPDERGKAFNYDDNSTQRMIDRLALAAPPRALDILTTWEKDAANIPPTAFSRKFNLALIDGEHTNLAVFSDFLSILPVLSRDAVVAFHDANLVLDGIGNIERFLRYEKTEHVTMFLRDCVAVIGLRGARHVIEAELGPHALDRVEYETWARNAVRAEIAQNFGGS
jgi:hypothetical protein